MIKKLALLFGLSGLGFSASGYASCWMQCIAHNPINGSCVGKVKMCNLEDPEKAIQSLGTDVGNVIFKIEEGWKHIYVNGIPIELRTMFDKYPLTIAAMVYPGTREYVLLVATLEHFAGTVNRRSQEAKDVQDIVPDWKDTVINQALVFVTVNEGIDIGIHDWKQVPDGYMPPRYDDPWRAFLGCVQGAPDLTAAEQCLKTFKRAVVDVDSDR